GTSSSFTVVVVPNDIPVTGIPVCAAATVPLINVPVATFQPVINPDVPPPRFTATIDWGDGAAATAGTITQNGTTFTVLGSHTYAAEGTFAVRVTVTSSDGHAGTGTTTATVGGFVTSLYRNLLERAPDAQGLAAWQNVLVSGASRVAVAYAFWTSTEHHGRE